MLSIKLSAQLELIQIRALRIIFGQNNVECLMDQYSIPLLASRRDDLCIRFFKKLSTECNPLSINLSPVDDHCHNLRNKFQFKTIDTRTARFSKSFVPYGLQNWQKHL